MKIEKKLISELIPYANNARTHNPEQITQIASSIKEFGFNNPILIDKDNGIIAGHGRLEAAKKLNLTKAPTIKLEHLTDQQRKAYILADNRIAVNSDWDNELLSLELKDLNAEFDLTMLGFNEKELTALLEPEQIEGNTDEDAVPELPNEPTTKLGDIYKLGNHRLMCGDSTDINSLEKLCLENADLIFTDPPYGMSYGGGRAAGSTKKGALVKAHGMIKNDDLSGDSLITLIRDALTTAYTKCKKGAGLYACFTWRTYAEFEKALKESGFTVKNCIVWNKKSIGLGNANYRPQHEFIFYCGGQWYGNKSESDVWELSRGATSNYVHPTQKPVELVIRALNNSSKAGDIVIDCFGGSGSTMIAAEKTGRHSRLMELDPKYCDVIIKRWEDFTGKKAELL